MVQNAFRSVVILHSINRLFIVLILKAKQASTFNQFRPISLCNTSYKIVSKLLVKRIRPVLDKFISPSQTAFITGRWIGENTILVNKSIHTMKKKKSGASLVGFKIDWIKAYDRIDWGILTRIITPFGFSSKVNVLILDCVSVASVDLLLNGSVFNKIDMQRGIWQGDPLSLFLFIMYAELLSRMLLKLEQEEKIHGIKIGRTSPAISHLLFADDILLFCKANLDEVREVFQCLNLFCNWTGQKINYAKSKCFFLENTKGRVKSDIKKLFGLK